MATDTAKVLETLGKMTVLELVELKNAIEEEWGVTAAAPVAVAAAAPAGGGGDAGAAEEKDTFDRGREGGRGPAPTHPRRLSLYSPRTFPPTPPPSGCGGACASAILRGSAPSFLAPPTLHAVKGGCRILSSTTVAPRARTSF